MKEPVFSGTIKEYKYFSSGDVNVVMVLHSYLLSHKMNYFNTERLILLMSCANWNGNGLSSEGI